MKDCDHCFHYRNQSCSGITCIGYKPVGSIDVDILKSASERLDQGRHARSKYSSRLFAESEERVKAAERKRAVLSRQTQEPNRDAVDQAAKRASVEAALRAWRLEQARIEKLPAYCIFPDSTLYALISADIKTKGNLLSVRGIGTKLYAKYADALFEILRNK